jgi:acyl-CoA oxidase
VRRQLHAILEAGFSPLDDFSKDVKRYFYLGECLALVDLSLMVSTHYNP